MNKVSVIIPTYNRRHLVGLTIDNILNQSLIPYEIIVVDDNSSDDTLEWLTEVYGNKLILLTNKGKGPGAARNTGLQRATGTYIKFFDSDDLMTLNTLEEQSRCLENSESMFVYSPYIHAIEFEEGLWESTDNSILQYHKIPDNKSIHQWMCRGLFVCIPSMMFKREILDSVGSWREDITAYEDWDYMWRLAEHESHPLHTNKCAFLYRIHGTQTTVSNFSHAQRDNEKRIMLSTIYNTLGDDVNLLDKLWYQHYLQPNYNGLLNYFFRFSKKLGRMITKTDWQPMHGVLKDSLVINHFINLTYGK